MLLCKKIFTVPPILYEEPSNLNCKLPFRYKGSTYKTCKFDKEKDGTLIRWCSTKVDDNDQHEEGNWGNCDVKWEMGCHVKDEKTDDIRPCIFPFQWNMPCFLT